MVRSYLKSAALGRGGFQRKMQPGQGRLTLWMLLIFWGILFGCGQLNDRTEQRGEGKLVKDSMMTDSVQRIAAGLRDSIERQRLSADSDANRDLFQEFFAVFVKAVQRSDTAALERMIHFPLQTASTTTASGRDYWKVDSVADLVYQHEFLKCYPDIFYAELRRQFRTVKLDEVEELENVGEEGYYGFLHKITDKGSPMFELYAQWTFTDAGLAGSYFGFVFGKVDGAYKVLSYYGKFPAKYISTN